VFPKKKKKKLVQKINLVLQAVVHGETQICAATAYGVALKTIAFGDPSNTNRVLYPIEVL
jgi:hypothetical protein